MSMLIEGVDMPRGTNMMLLISPEGDVLEMGDLMGNDKLIEGAKAIPAADVRPVVRGRWINQGADSEICSACGSRFYISALFAVGINDEPNFCPNCGADMREEN